MSAPCRDDKERFLSSFSGNKKEDFSNWNSRRRLERAKRKWNCAQRHILTLKCVTFVTFVTFCKRYCTVCNVRFAARL